MLGLAGLLLTGATSVDDCGAARAAAPNMTVCVANAGGVVLAMDADEAKRLAAIAAAGEARFERWFGVRPARYAVIQGEAGAPVLAALKAAGFAVDLPWFTRDAFQSSVEASVRRQVEAQTAGMSPDQAQAALDKALAQIRTRLAAGSFDRDPQAVPHELGHGWYVQAFWPGLDIDTRGHYGGPGPDWMDETAAVLMETDAAADDRRAQFREAYRGGDGLKVDDLALFLHRDHPMKAVAEAAGRNGAGVTVMRSQDGGSEFANARQAGIFYAQGRVFADFMIERSGKPTVFADIGRAFGQGRTIEQWLAAEGPALKLGATVADLDRLWRAWLVVKYGPPAV